MRAGARASEGASARGRARGRAEAGAARRRGRRRGRGRLRKGTTGEVRRISPSRPLAIPLSLSISLSLSLSLCPDANQPRAHGGRERGWEEPRDLAFRQPCRLLPREYRSLVQLRDEDGLFQEIVKGEMNIFIQGMAPNGVRAERRLPRLMRWPAAPGGRPRPSRLPATWVFFSSSFLYRGGAKTAPVR